MKVKYLNSKEELWLKFWEIYNVFAIILWKDKEWNKYYIKASWPKFVYPHDVQDFEIIDASLSRYFLFWINQFGDFVIWPSEISRMEYFWPQYYEEVQEYTQVIDKYYNLARDELFNE